jgi:hypothetical protein
MIRDYSDYIVRRWHELGVSEQQQTLEPESPQIRDLHCGWLLTVAGELQHTTQHEGRDHPDVGLLFKNWGNFYDAGSGLQIATDILCVRDTDEAGDVTDEKEFAIIDVITSVFARHSAPGWGIHGLADGGDRERFRDAPKPADVEPGDGNGGDGGDGGVIVNTDEIVALLHEIRTGQIEDAVIQQRIVSAIEGLRRDTQNAARLLAQLIAGGGGINLDELIRRDRPVRPAPLRIGTLPSYRRGVPAAHLPRLPEGFDVRDDNWRAQLMQRRTEGAGDGQAKDRRADERQR